MNTFTIGQRVVIGDRHGTVQAVRTASELYPESCKPTKNGKGQHQAAKYKSADVILQVLIDGDRRASNHRASRDK